MRTRLALLIVLTIAAGLVLDASGAPWAQPVVDVWAWCVMALLIWQAFPRDRLRLLACLVIASAGEVVLSLVWGLYDYRLSNIPLFVPPGHVMLYALGMWLSVRLPTRALDALGPVALVVALGLAFSARDVLSLPLTLLFLASLRFGPAPRLYSTMFLLALSMELWGTWLGNWAWRGEVPGLAWPTLNPPFAAGAFYCVLDWLVGLLLPRRTALEPVMGQQHGKASAE
jgi:hypothetical protein